MSQVGFRGAASRAGMLLFLCATVGTALLGSGNAWAAATNAPIVGEIEQIQLDTPGDHWSGGKMVVGGQTIILPRNLLIDLPANRLTLQEMFDLAPPGCTLGAGIAKNDPCLHGAAGAQATIQANRTSNGNVIAGEVLIHKAVEFINGTVTFIDFDNGFFRINGSPNSATTGLMVRINDPQSKHTLQSGPGCRPTAANCSADERFGVDPDNYTAAFGTGFPLCIPSTKKGGLRTTAADQAGQGDPFCPQSNRGTPVVANSQFFAPLQLGDTLLVEGNYEVINGVRFLSAWHVFVNGNLATRNDPTQPDYVTTAEVGWDVPAFQNERARFLLIGFSTLSDPQMDVFALHYDPKGVVHEVPIASTVNNAQFLQQGLGVNAGFIWRIRYDVDFIAPIKPDLSPCTSLRNAGLPGCPLRSTTADDFAVLSPVARELIVRTRRTVPLAPGVFAHSIQGLETKSCEYLTPVGLVHPEFVEINLGNLNTALSFSGIPWNVDRRLGPGGCNGPCENTAQALDPFPFEDYDPRLQATIPQGTANRMFSFFPFGVNDRVSWPPPTAPAFPIGVTPPVPLVCAAPDPATVQMTLTDTSVKTANQGASGTSTLTGTNFTPDTTCSFGPGVTVTCTFVSPTQLTAAFTVATTAPLGARDIVVTGTNGVATLPGAFTVTSPPPAPTLTSVTPNTVTTGQTATLALIGTNFRAGMTCSFGAGITVSSCTLNSATSAVATVNVDAAATLGARDAVLLNADGTGVSLLRALTVTGPVTTPLVFTAVTPNSGTAGTSLTVQITGTGFQPGLGCNFGAGITVLSCNAFTSANITAALAIDLAAAPGARTVTVTNPGGQSVTGSFTVVAAAPAVDKTPPVVTAPVVTQELGVALGGTTIPVLVTWSATDASGVASYELSRSENGAGFRAVALPTATTTQIEQRLTPGITYQFRVRATDNAGNVSNFVTSAPFLVEAVQDNDPRDIYVGTWTTVLNASSFGGSLRSTTSGGSVSLDFTGSTIGWVAPQGPGRGIAQVSIDNVVVATVNLSAPGTLVKQFVFSRSVTPGAHRITVRSVGAAGTTVEMDAFVIHR